MPRYAKPDATLGTRLRRRLCWGLLFCAWLVAGGPVVTPVFAEAVQGPANSPDPSGPAPVNDARDWHYGAYLDLAYIVNFNFPENRLWRNRTTAAHHNEFAPNMGFGYVRKDISGASPWGMEVGLQGGHDSENFAFLQGERKVAGADTLRHIQRANVSYLAPVGHGLTVTAGLFSSLIGYESLYAKDNLTYTRSWLADYTPYMMFGIKAKYPLNDQLTVTGFIINGYFHLSHPNDQPSYGAQVVYKPTNRLTVLETLYVGPDQTNDALQFWRLYLNSIVEYKLEDVTLALSYDIGTEEIANRPGSPRAFVMGCNVEGRWHIASHWSISLRPGFYWDRNGRWTGHEQFVTAVTTTAEYAYPFGWTSTRVLLEHRWDESTGVGGGFFRGGDIQPGVPRLAPDQHLLLMGLLWTFDSP